MTTAYLTNWLYVAAFMLSGVFMVVAILVISAIVNPSHPSATKYATYECGIKPIGTPWSPFAVRYYIFALLFLIFDVEAVFMFPWTLIFRSLGTTGFVEVAIFILVLVVGLVYAWRKGVLEWV
jgi:NADH-quinone oxidoreductase subunit A